MITMKSIYLLAAILGLQFNTLFATGNFNESMVLTDKITYDGTVAMLMPETPMEASFEETAEPNENIFDLTALTPCIPMTADFSDEAPSMEINMLNLAPVTPAEADFEDGPAISNDSPMQDLAPVTPADADFGDSV